MTELETHTLTLPSHQNTTPCSDVRVHGGQPGVIFPTSKIGNRGKIEGGVACADKLAILNSEDLEF